jgi:hypothetical protein
MDYRLDERVAQSIDTLRNNADFARVIDWMGGLYVQAAQEAVKKREAIDIHQAQGSAQTLESILMKIDDSQDIAQKLYKKRIQSRLNT